MDSKKSVNVLESHRYLVFGTGRFPGNATTLNHVSAFPDDEGLLAHSRTLPTIDNAYWLNAGERDRFMVRCCSHTALLAICGHALLATGHHLLHARGLYQLRLETPAYRHACRRHGNTASLSLPHYPWRQVDDEVLLHKLLDVLGLQPRQVQTVLRFPFNVLAVITTSLVDLQNFRADAADWHQLDAQQPGAVLLSCAQAEGGYAFRYFTPWWGKREDSATGSAHCYLASWWLQEGARAQAIQWSPEGPATMEVMLENDQVWISGEVAVLPGTGQEPSE